MSDLFWIRRIPDVMAKLKFFEAQKLQERWFGGSPFEFTDEYRRGKIEKFESLPVARYDDEIVSISWALLSPKPSQAYSELLNDWHRPVPSLNKDNKKNRRQLMEMTFASNLRDFFLSEQGVSAKETSFVFGNLNSHPRLLKKYMVQRQPVEMSLKPTELGGDPIDGWYAACANASWELAVQANIDYLGDHLYRVEIDKCAVYLFDIFDFYDQPEDFPQWLGCWGYSGVSMGCLTGIVEVPIRPPSFNRAHSYGVWNSSYRNYRADSKSGGDFFLFSSDVRIKSITPSVVFNVSVK
jgi:hypothetical protein